MNSKQFAVFSQNLIQGNLDIGSRNAVKDAPVWATPEVYPGGFASGLLMASFDTTWETEMIVQRLGNSGTREQLNKYFLSQKGIEELVEVLQSGCYSIDVPEEGALLVIAHLFSVGKEEECRRVLLTILPEFGRLRFFPRLLAAPAPIISDHQVRVVSAKTVLTSFSRLKSRKCVLRNQNDLHVWEPIFADAIEVLVATGQDGALSQVTADSIARAKEVIARAEEAKKLHVNTRLTRANTGKGFVLDCVKKLSESNEGKLVDGVNVPKLRAFLAKYVNKRGATREARLAYSKQLIEKNSPKRPELPVVVEPVVKLLQSCNPEAGLALDQWTTFSAGKNLPKLVKSKVWRCVEATPEVLIDNHAIKSPEMLAACAAPLSAHQLSCQIPQAEVQRLFSQLYVAFRSRRSLVLVNYESQVGLHEVPWIDALFLSASISNKASESAASVTLKRLVNLSITRFPQNIVPNKMLQEVKELAKNANLNSFPVVEEIASDIFQGGFGPKFVKAAKIAADVLSKSDNLYTRYYQINWDEVKALPTEDKVSKEMGLLCSARAVHLTGIPIQMYNTASNGCIIEQEQIVTTHNLAAFISILKLDLSVEQLLELATKIRKDVFAKMSSVKRLGWINRLRTAKNAAFAWRQMIFFLSLVPQDQVVKFVHDLQKEFASSRNDEFKTRFGPAVEGLVECVNARVGEVSSKPLFLGWSASQHPFLPPSERKDDDDDDDHEEQGPGKWQKGGGDDDGNDDNNYDDEEYGAGEDDDPRYACDMCLDLFSPGDVRYHSTIDENFDCCQRCLTKDLREEHKFIEIMTESTQAWQ